MKIYIKKKKYLYLLIEYLVSYFNHSSIVDVANNFRDRRNIHFYKIFFNNNTKNRKKIEENDKKYCTNASK